MKEVDGLDISKEGSEALEVAMKRYNERIETRITARLRDQLGTAKNANEMFRIFSRFNALFVRPHIRGAIREYQTQLILQVNFLPEIIQLSKEVRNLKNLGFRVPLAIVNKAHQANQLYPFAISLIESVRTYERNLEKMETRPNITLLVAGLRKDVQQLITEGCALVWESYKLDPYVQGYPEQDPEGRGRP